MTRGAKPLSAEDHLEQWLRANPDGVVPSVPAPIGNHGARKHSRIGPSASHRYMHCPISVIRSAPMPNKSSVFAREGSAAHELAEYVLVNNIDPYSMLGGVVILDECLVNALLAGKTRLKPGVYPESKDNPEPDQENIWLIDDEMCEAVELYQETIQGILQAEDELLVETRLSLEHIHPDMFGSSDAIIYRKQSRHLFVLDFKYGSGLAVEVDDNSQLLSYAIGALRLFHGKVDRVTLIVVQPRAHHRDGPVRMADYALFDLYEFEEFLTDAALRTEDPNSPHAVGEWCRFCPAAPTCVDLREHCLRVIGVKKVQRITEAALPKFKDMKPEQIAAVLREVTVIESWIRRFLEYAHDQALAGNMPPGFKLVPKRAYRKFKDADEVIELLETLGYDEGDYMYEPKLRTPNQLEKVLGKKQFKALLSDFVTKKNTHSTVLAPDDDEREAVKVDKSDAFGAVEDED